MGRRFWDRRWGGHKSASARGWQADRGLTPDRSNVQGEVELCDVVGRDGEEGRVLSDHGREEGRRRSLRGGWGRASEDEIRSLCKALKESN